MELVMLARRATDSDDRVKSRTEATARLGLIYPIDIAWAPELLNLALQAAAAQVEEAVLSKVLSEMKSHRPPIRLSEDTERTLKRHHPGLVRNGWISIVADEIGS